MLCDSFVLEDGAAIMCLSWLPAGSLQEIVASPEERACDLEDWGTFW